MAQRTDTVFPFEPKLNDVHIVPLITFNGLIFLSNIFMNLLVIFVMWKLKLYKTLSHRLILYLNISDLCVGVFVQPSFAMVLLERHVNTKPAMRLAAQFLTFTFVQFSGVMTMIITLDRYLHMKYLQFYNVHMTSQKAAIFIGVNLLSSIGLAISYTFASLKGFYFYLNIIFIFCDLTVLIVAFLLYGCTFLSLKDHLRDSKTTSRRDLEFARVMVLLITALFICYMPYFVIGAIVSFKRRSQQSPLELSWLLALYCTYLLTYFNSTCNAVLFMLFNRKIRKFLTKKMRRNDKVNEVSTTLEYSKDTGSCSSRNRVSRKSSSTSKA